IVVVLPAPFRPRKPNTSPCSTVSETSRSAATRPYRLPRCSRRMAGAFTIGPACYHPAARPMTLRPLLAGGDRRSQARSTDVLARVHADNALVAELVALVGDDDWLVSMRALDLLEKLAHTHP